MARTGIFILEIILNARGRRQLEEIKATYQRLREKELDDGAVVGMGLGLLHWYLNEILAKRRKLHSVGPDGFGEVNLGNI